MPQDLFGIPLLHLALPLIGAVIGWTTNYIAVKMLFHPRRPLRLLFFTVQGVFPKRQKAFAHKLGALVSDELFSVQDVTSHLSEVATSDESIAKVQSRIESMISTRLPEVFPMAAMVLTPELVQQISEQFKPDIREMVQSMIDELASAASEELDVHTIVEDKVANFSVEKLEEVVFAIMKREFRFIEFVGAILGFLIGLTQVALVVNVG